MRVLVTGGAGFIGRHLVAELAAAGHEVRVLDALLPESHPGGAPPELPAGVEFVHGDLRDADAVDRALRGVDLVSHQAAVVGRGREVLDAAHHVSCNDLGTAVLVAAMARREVPRLLMAGTVAIYGDSRYDCPVHGRVRPERRSRADLAAGRFEPRCGQCGAELVASAVTEEDVADPPRNIYAVSKFAQELLAGTWARETGGQAVVLRYHNVYGPHIPYQSPYSGVAAVFRSAVARGQAPEVYEDGGSLRDFVHVRDVAAAHTAALAWTGGGFRAFNIASGVPRSIGEVAAALAAAVGAPEPVVTGRFRIGDVRHIVAAPARALRELAWRPAVDFETGMKEFATAPMRGGPS
ncbi:NAD-dependent epimerase/dehydratase family protein [Crossiella sp. SN42]|uniref:NAD-dependent epimerase/dehydratase family protein n=1 Tax=Crossiella sp. SN42 TaxID=2944808 RepID=UPI00207CEB8B|nr:NAD-dependent epimerase/dehydratase family protein [Crossiella sp. SN42]MCO1580327.1 NAD-dependent epimerase/dehydratase family protein [Crossiella sp. SN42]